MVVDHLCVNYGAELYQELLNALYKRGVEQNVFYPRNKRHRIADQDESFRIDSPEVLNSITKLSFSKKRRIMRQQYDPLFHRNKPDLIHAPTLFSDGSLANHFFKKFSTPFIVAVRSTDLDVFLKYKPWLLPYGKQIVENATSVIFISPSLRKKFLEIFGDNHESKFLLIPNGIKQSYLDIETPGEKEYHTPLELLYVGSFQKLKNVPTLIKLAEKTKSRVTIVGAGGGEEKKVLQLIRNSDKVNYLGRIEDSSILTQIYRQSDIFVMVSQRETFGLVYAEAMSQGLPLIYSLNTGIDGLFDPGLVGFGVSQDSVPEMMEKIERILANYQEISRNCISEARQFNWTSIAEKYHELYMRGIDQSAI
jgi:glycosyltransferase involved in cell wall biosynthesis